MNVKQDYNQDLNRKLLVLATAGSVDDGKSTLIGRLFYDCRAIYQDQLRSIKEASKKKGMKEVDLSLLTDGLSAEREQGITIDVAYRYFNTAKRRIIIADVPGHEQYTRNMITGASNADAVLILADARKGLLIQSKRHLFIASLLGITHIVVVINKMDQVKYKQEVFERIKSDFISYASKLNIKDLDFIPVSALKGDMVVKRGRNLPWYEGDTLLYYLENIPLFSNRNIIDFRLPVQYVVRLPKSGRAYAGKIEGGGIKEGEEVIVLPSRQKTKIKSLIVNGCEADYAFNPQTVIVKTADELDVSRGDMIVRENNMPEADNKLEAMLCWLSEEPMKLNKNFLFKQTTNTDRASIIFLQYCLNVENLHRDKNTKELKLNHFGRVSIETNKPIFFDSFIKNKNTGSFILIDEITKKTTAAGIILGKSQARSASSPTKSPILWFTGLSGSGKSTIADKIYKYLQARGIACEMLDGDELRQTINKDLGFSEADRNKNIERAAYIANLLSRNNIFVLATFISPYRKQRSMAKKILGNFVEVFVNSPLDVCQKRDIKGLYQKAKQGKVKFMTGVDDRYEKPTSPDIELKTDRLSSSQCADKVIKYLKEKNLI